MNTNNVTDTARLSLLLNELRLPAIKLLWPQFAEQADKEGWPAARFLTAIAEHELAERDRRRIERHLAEARLLPGKTLDTFAFEAVPMISKAQITALAAGDAWLEKGANLLLFGPPGGGKSHLASALGLALVENGWKVLFTRTTDLVQKLQVARRELDLEAAINRLDRFHLLILDDLAYVTKDQAETSVLFELISARYERRSMLVTANQPFGEWGKVFPDPAMTLAAIDRLVHHATIFEMNVESYRRREAMERKRGPGRPASYATPANISADCRATQNRARSALIWSRWRLDMHRSSESVAAIATALAKAQTELSNPEKAMVGTVYNNRSDSPQSFRYASLSSGLDIIRKTLGGQQIAIAQTTDIDRTNGTLNLTTTLATHVRGVDRLGLAGLPVIRDICTPADGSGADLRPTLCSLHNGGDRWRG